MLYVYAFVEAPAALPSGGGIDAAPLGAEAVDGLEAIVSRHETTVEASEDAIVAHARVVEAIADANDAVLPARFGGMHASGDELRGAVGARAAELTAALDRVRGCVELGVRALAPSVERATAAASGGAYMRERLEQRRETARIADELHAPLAALAREATSTVGATQRLLLTGAYLVPRDAVEAFRDEVAGLESAHAELTVVCTGPWPPYSFATAEGGS